MTQRKKWTANDDRSIWDLTGGWIIKNYIDWWNQRKKKQLKKKEKEKDADHFEFKTVHLKKINVDLPHACHRTLQALQVYQECLLFGSAYKCIYKIHFKHPLPAIGTGA